ncbi:MAG: phosphopantetheine-binding protein [Coprobacillus sp.]|nr:phosphopantetheine-binding protein [Coprobacillus sp.]
MNIDEILTSILSKRIDVSTITDSSVLSDLGLDSLDLVEVMMEIETELNVEFSNEEILAIKTIKDVKALIKSKVS